MRPYRESPLLARARRTESFHSCRDFHTLSLGRGLERAVPEDAGAGPIQAEVKRAAGDGEGPEPPAAGGGPEADAGPEDDGERGEPRRKGGLDGGGLLGRKKGPHLASSPGTSDGGADSPGAASPSPTKTTPSPRHRKSDSSGPEAGL